MLTPFSLFFLDILDIHAKIYINITVISVANIVGALIEMGVFMIKKILFINGIERRTVANPECTLLDFLRKQMFLLGVKENHGNCTIILNGKAVAACGVKMKDVPADARITTIEGLESCECLHPLQTSWLLHKAAQCGVCAPAFIMSAKALLDENPNPAKKDVEAWFKANGNACKHVDSGKAADAVLDAALLLSGKATKEELWLKRTGEVYTPCVECADACQVAMVTGEFETEADLGEELPEGTLYAKLVCPSESKANVFSIDVSEAEKEPGVFKVITSKDVTGTNMVGSTEKILSDRSVSGPGDAIAAVLGFTRAAASEAVCKVKATIEAQSQEGKGKPSEKCCCNRPAVAFAYVNEKGKLVIHTPRTGLNASALEDGIGIPRGQLSIVNIPGQDASAAGGSSIEGIAAAAALAAGKPVYLEA
jgi:aldehyde oxidoreductase